ncbi:MAG: type 1 glutamine amidotransferase-like domain-containing protein [Candidatus Pacebacteria bacterium]|nr:type 1 glutamine amidotransferase-like domain-containing protein [Candidatus Paceibacterota bacterium]PIR63203.1 MAG: hypothetical protein COU64_05805 [Candidatus Pacebacteria bacterium CG10_big_fil_rev_8_21_14_0_10_40_26]PIZ78233.1 MAG: hypothetical protein COY01_05625 [Candidatus Pacebacteria bacterium CG_4_10_14_0_2_um_filter_40_20]PJA68722.1 MAG: hypothetical protein CO156_04420 [Candidatus Pacebacteria bacterium CG_4_9_14_3_um_filter_40_12]PJC41662.1 MAG: hypothetical protein CO041_0301
MKRLFLTSSTNFVSHHLVKNIDLSKGNRLAFILTAAEVEHGDKQWLKDDRQSLVDAGFDVFDYTITGKTKSEIEQELASADILYFSGGNTFYLLQQSQKSGFIPVVQDMVENQGKIYIGTSAGSIIAGPQLPKYLLELGEEHIADNLLDATAYGFVNFILLPHWGSEGFKQKYLESRLKLIYTPDQFPLVVLTDQQYVKVEGDSLEIIDTSR